MFADLKNRHFFRLPFPLLIYIKKRRTSFFSTFLSASFPFISFSLLGSTSLIIRTSNIALLDNVVGYLTTHKKTFLCIIFFICVGIAWHLLPPPQENKKIHFSAKINTSQKNRLLLIYTIQDHCNGWSHSYSIPKLSSKLVMHLVSVIITQFLKIYVVVTSKTALKPIIFIYIAIYQN